MMKHSITLQGLLKNKPTVKRGSLRSGITQQYVCHGFCKNPLDKDIGEYAYNPGVEETERVILTEGTNNIVRDIEEKGHCHYECSKSAKMCQLHQFC